MIGARGLESALRMAEPIAKINFKNAAYGPGNEVILLYYIFFNIYFDSASQIWGYFVNSCPVKILM